MAAEGIGGSTDLAPRDEEIKTDAAIQLAQAPQYQAIANPSAPQQPVFVQQIQAVPQVVIVPNTTQTTTQSVTTSAGNWRNKEEVGMTVAGSELVNQNLNYFQARDDTGSYDEDMKPWEKDGQNYSFACCTEQREHAHVQQKGAYPSNPTKQTQGSSAIDWIHSVYHKTGSTRLIIKRKSGVTGFGEAKKNPFFKYAVAMFIAGALLVVVALMLDSEESGLILGGGVILMAAGVVSLCCTRKNQITQTFYQLVSQSIPIASIFFVEREVQQLTASQKCSCCENSSFMTSKTDISIGYNRSNLSRLLNGEASHEDFITFKLDSNQAYNLHQYLNCIIDGSHPQTNGNVVMRSGGNVLPRTSTFQASGGSTVA